MLKNYTVLLLLFISAPLFAQESRYIDSTYTWTVLSTGFGNNHTTSFLRMKGDTVFGARNYKKVFSSADSLFSVSTYEGGIRQDTLNKKVYFRSWDIGCGPEELLADLSLNKGDSTQSYTCAPMYFTVDSVDSVYIDGSLKRRQIFGYFNGWPVEYCIEGIGSSFSLIKPHWNFCVADLEFHVTCVRNKHTVIWTNPDFGSCIVTGMQQHSASPQGITIYPDPAHGYSVIDPGKGSYTRFMIFDLNGKCIRTIGCTPQQRFLLDCTRLSKGIYFFRAEGESETETGRFIVQ